MSLARLKARTPSAKRIGTFILPGHSLRFHMISDNDGSGKCDALFTGRADDSVIGALFEIVDSEKEILDKVEGLGYWYQSKMVSVSDAQGKVFEALTYYAVRIHPCVLPYSWYLYHVLYGAKEIGVPVDYLAAIENTQTIEDPDRERDARERAIYR